MKRIITTIAAASLLLVACNSDSETEPAATSASPTSDTVRMITYDSYAISDQTLEAFTEQTGLTVEIVRASDAGELVNRSILTKANPEADLIFGVDNTLLSRAEAEGLFDPYQPVGSDTVPADLVPNDAVAGDWLVTPIDTGEVCVNIDNEFFGQSGRMAPQALSELTDQQYRGQLVVQDPAASSPGLAFLLATVETFGEDGYLDFWQGLKDNDVQIDPGWSEAYYGSFSGGAGEGDRPLVVSYATSPAAEVEFAEGPVEEAPTSALLDGCFLQIEYAGVLANADNPGGAQQLLDFMITRTYQDDIAGNNFVYPILPDAGTPASFTEYAPQPSEPVRMDPQRIAENRDDWVAAWNDLMRS